MPWIALVGPEFEENLSLRYLASSLQQAGFDSRLLAFNRDLDLVRIADAILEADEPPIVVGLSLSFQWRARDFLALAMTLKERGYAGHITAGGHFATFACAELLRDFPELDSICRQEAEGTMVTLARAVQAGAGPAALAEIPGLGVRDAKEVWIIDPESRTVEIWSSPNPPDRDLSIGEDLISALLPGFVLPLEKLFS